jgi:hypothetical protein
MTKEELLKLIEPFTDETQIILRLASSEHVAVTSGAGVIDYDGEGFICLVEGETLHWLRPRTVEDRRCKHVFPDHGHADSRCALPSGHGGRHKCSGEMQPFATHP